MKTHTQTYTHTHRHIIYLKYISSLCSGENLSQLGRVFLDNKISLGEFYYQNDNSNYYNFEKYLNQKLNVPELFLYVTL